MLSLDMVREAAVRLRDVVRRTDLVRAPELRDEADLYLKTENLQLTGSFKVRGAFYKMTALTPAERERGVIACSAGNHAQGVALAATRFGIPSLICLPDGAPISKVEATKRLGAEVRLVAGAYDDAYREALRLAEETGRTFVHPFDDDRVIAGQGTIALELLDQRPDLEAVVVPVGGGGLAGGVAFVLKALAPRVKVYGVQAKGAPAMARAVRAGRVEALAHVATIADGIAVKEPSERTFALCREYVDEIVTVDDDEISAAILALIERHKCVAEGAGAAAVAAALFGKVPVDGRRAVCVVSGGNIDVTILSRVISRGLLTSGRTCGLVVELLDKPGQLKGVSAVIADLGGNVISIHHERASENRDVNGCTLRLVLETRNFAHIAAIHRGLADAGYAIVSGGPGAGG